MQEVSNLFNPFPDTVTRDQQQKAPASEIAADRVDKLRFLARFYPILSQKTIKIKGRLATGLTNLLLKGLIVPTVYGAGIV